MPARNPDATDLGAAVDAELSGLCDLHLWIDRPAQGRGRGTCRVAEPGAYPYRIVRRERPGHACCNSPRSALTRRSRKFSSPLLAGSGAGPAAAGDGLRDRDGAGADGAARDYAFHRPALVLGGAWADPAGRHHADRRRPRLVRPRLLGSGRRGGGCSTLTARPRPALTRRSARNCTALVIPPIGRPVRQYPALRAGRCVATGSGQGYGRALRRRRWAGARLSRPGGDDGGTFSLLAPFGTAGAAGCTAPGIWVRWREDRAGWTSPDASMTRSKSAVSAWSWARSRRGLRSTPQCCTGSGDHARRQIGRLRRAARAAAVADPLALRAACGGGPAGVHGTASHRGCWDALPLTANGKLDRRSLPAPDPVLGQSVAPRTGLETALVALYAKLLGVPQIGIDDSFFERGWAFGCWPCSSSRRSTSCRTARSGLPDIFVAPTVRQLALRISSGAGRSAIRDPGRYSRAARPRRMRRRRSGRSDLADGSFGLRRPLPAAALAGQHGGPDRLSGARVVGRACQGADQGRNAALEFVAADRRDPNPRRSMRPAPAAAGTGRGPDGPG